MAAMHTTINTVTLVVKEGHEKARQLAQDIRTWLHSQAIQVHVVTNGVDCVILEPGKDQPDIVMVLGGDGTMLSVARKINGHAIPMLGVNLGHVGFLTETNPATWQDMLSLVLAGRASMSSRVVLNYTLYRQGETAPSCTGKAFNDLVVNRGELARLINLDVAYGPHDHWHVRADGLIVSTPTGSTGYCVSAGGPLVYPDFEVFVITPVCPFLHPMPPLVLPFDYPLMMTVLSNNQEVYLTQDGQKGMALYQGDRIEITRAKTRIRLIHAATSSYIAKLKTTGFIRYQP
ncbi:MAG: NAD(+) kinase [Deltaproteobacteria bacterium]|nr:MAG: NAD(+) kinase [Deltaproteobacteria bacterium]